MKNLIGLIFIASLVLSGCQTTKLVPVYMMPTAPVNLTVPLPDLQPIKKSDEQSK